jgi:hypothetical protein
MDMDLTDLDDAYKTVAGGRLPDGVYPAKLIKAEVSLSKAGDRQVVWDLEVHDLATGRTIKVRKYSPLQPNSLFWLHADLTRLNVTLGSLNDLYQALQALEGATVQIDLKYDTKDGWYKPNFMRLVSKAF